MASSVPESALDPVSAQRAAPSSPSRLLSGYAWGLLAYLIFVILFGAWVRITGSGAGCGRHWPTCHGEVIPKSPEIETIIEFTHRATSGLLGLLVLGLVGWAFAARWTSRRARAAASVALFFTALEALIGARLVLGELVASDDSIARAVVIAIHLLSTFSLTAATALTAWWAADRTTSPSVAAEHKEPSPVVSVAQSRTTLLLGLALAAVLVVSMTGAVTALGDTLFPVSPTEGEGLFARLRSDLSPTSHFLVRLRIVHPVLAVLVSGFLLALPSYIDERAAGSRAARMLDWLRVVVILQVAAGVANIWLGAPGAMQIGHLFAAQILWLLLVLAFVTARDQSGSCCVLQ